jgi:hypothetical protein
VRPVRSQVIIGVVVFAVVVAVAVAGLVLLIAGR